MKTNSWIWVLTILLILTFLALCAGISLAANNDINITSTLLFFIIGVLGVVLLVIVIIIFGILNKNRHNNEDNKK